MQNILWSWHFRHNPNGTPVGPGGAPNLLGLDPKIIQSFPTFIYSTVKDYRKEKYGLECAICLVEFSNDDILRLLTSCCHVFHQECIDLWLDSHNTCPVCRSSLDSGAETSPEKSPSTAVHDVGNENSTGLDHESFVVVSIKDENEDEKSGERKSNSSSGREHEQIEGKLKVAKFPRSHSTGHSVVRNRGEGGEEDRFTLRLPEYVKSKIVKGHNPTRSCINFGDQNKNETTVENVGFGQVPGILSLGDINRV